MPQEYLTITSKVVQSVNCPILIRCMPYLCDRELSYDAARRSILEIPLRMPAAASYISIIFF